MSKQNTNLLGCRLLFGLLAVCAFATDALAFRSGPPAFVNGSTSSTGNSCMLCHGAAVGTGSVTILNAPTQYQPSAVYHLIVRIQDNARAGAGFQISAESPAGVHQGTFTLTNAGTQLNPTNNRFVNHNTAGVNAAVAAWVGLGNSAEYPVDWQAPANDVGPITFWAAGNAINNNGLSNGDLIYLTNVTATFAPNTGACCDDPTGVCTNNVLGTTCINGGDRYGGDGSTCANIDPPCVAPPTGACCDDVRGQCSIVTQTVCDAIPGSYGGDDSLCSDFDPPCVVKSIGLELVASGLVSPVAVTHAGDGSGRLFVVDQSGMIRVIDPGGTLLAAPFLDLSATIPTLSPFFDERGVLGLAFHPNYESNGRFFVRYSLPRAGLPEEPCNDPGGFIVGCHEEILAEFAVLGDPLTSNVADPGSEIILYRVDKPQFNHDGGGVAFGPDGLLYWTYGDGGGAHDGLADVPPSHGPFGNGQNIETALGKVLRIDVDSPPDLGLDYHIPADNPFVGVAGLDEIYAYGLRNPFQFSFDDGPGGTGALYLGDVGQALYEEVDIIVKGGNYGWVIREGFHCFDPFAPGNPPANCPTTGALGEPLLDPVSEYSHEEGGVSVIGGFVYRGAGCPSLAGNYLYGDFAAPDFSPSGRLYYFNTTGPDAYVRREFFLAPNGDPFGQYLKGFGEDEDGEVYVCGTTDLAPTGSSGKVWRIVPPQPRATGESPRYIRITPPPSTDAYAIAVTPDCAGGPTRYVGTPSGPDNIAFLVNDAASAARLTSTQWKTTVFATGIDIVPSQLYSVRTDTGTITTPVLSSATSAMTAKWGDLIAPIGLVNFQDVNACVRAFQGSPGALKVPGADVMSTLGCSPQTPDRLVNFIDISNIVRAFQSQPYPCPTPCP